MYHIVLFIKGWGMNFFTDDQLAQLYLNWSDNSKNDFVPVAYLQLEASGYQWLITELNPNDTNCAFGLVNINGDISHSFIDLNELNTMSGELFAGSDISKLSGEEVNQVAVLSDLGFRGDFPLSIYYLFSKEKGRILIDPKEYKSTNKSLKHSFPKF